MAVSVIFDGGDAQRLSALEAPLDRRNPSSESVALTNEADASLICAVVWPSHWDISVESELAGESESEVAKVVLAVQGYVEGSLLGTLTVKPPAWSLAMDAIDAVWITVAAEWIADKLTFCSLDLAACREAASWSGEPCKPSQVVALEVNVEQELGLKIGRRLGDAGVFESWVLVVEDLDLILGELVSHHGGIDVDWIPLDCTAS